MDINEYAQYRRDLPESQIIRVDLEDAVTAQERITLLINNRQSPVRHNIETEYGHQRYIETTLAIYKNLIQ